ncbi:MAG: Rrf2 family transcriptional regulator [Cystobacter sp.]
MRSDSRLWRILHVLIHMERHDGRATSEVIAKMLTTHPVVVRRTMAGLKARGYVTSDKGHGGGWRLVSKLEDITVLDIYQALGEPAPFAIGPPPGGSDCPVEATVNAALDVVLQETEAALLARLGGISLADLSRAFDRRMETAARGAPTPECDL